MGSLRAILGCLCLLLVAQPTRASLAQASDPFPVPAGWQKARSGDAMILHPEGLGSGQAAGIIVFPEQVLKGDLRAWMLAALQAIHANTRVMQEPPLESGQQGPGLPPTPSPTVATARTSAQFFTAENAIFQRTREALGFRSTGRFKEALGKHQEGLKLAQGLLEALKGQPEAVRAIHDPILRAQVASPKTGVQYCLVRVGRFEEGLALSKDILAGLDEAQQPLQAGQAHVALAEAYHGL